MQSWLPHFWPHLVRTFSLCSLAKPRAGGVSVPRPIGRPRPAWTRTRPMLRFAATADGVRVENSTFVLGSWWDMCGEGHGACPVSSQRCSKFLHSAPRGWPLRRSM